MTGAASDEAHLIGSDERFRLIVEAVQDYAIFMLDPEGRVVTWNSGAERIKGYHAAEIIGRDFSCFYPQADVELGKPQALLRQAAEFGRAEIEQWRVRKNGSRFLSHLVITAVRDAAGSLLGFSEISRDLTERRESEARYRGLLEAAPDAMVVVDAAGGIVLLNAQAELVFGYRRDELLGRKVVDIIPTGFVERLIADGARSSAEAAAQQMGAGIELVGRCKNGREFPIEIMLSPLHSADGLLVTAAIRDISGRKQTEAKLNSAIVELRRSNDELEQFAYIASHDLQEPLRMVASYTQLLARRYKGRLDADADEFIGYAVDGANRMQQLILDLLAYSRAGTSGGVPQKISSESALQVAEGNLQVAILESGATVTHDPLPEVTMDAAQLAQVLQNLIGNAIKYRGVEPPRVHVTSVPTEAAEWQFAVRDNGIGIEAQYFDRIFVLFQRLHGRGEFEGTGIGLAICRKVLERIGGRIWVESEYQQGSTFSFAVPRGVGE